MRTSYIVGAIIVILIIGGIAYAVHGNSSMDDMSSQMASTTASSDDAAESGAPVTITHSTTTTTTVAPAPKSFTVNGNDATADVKEITVAKGTPVTITFGADAGTTYHGGLDFRSSVVNTGTIVPGSTKTVTFTADHTFSFTPYWPATNIAKPYVITVTVH